MIRSIKYKLHPNKTKKETLEMLQHNYKEAVNHYIESFINHPPKSRKNSYKNYDSGILKTKRLEDNAAQTAHDITTSWLKGPKKNEPTFTGNSITLNAKNVQIQKSNNTFDKWLYIQPYRLYIPFNLYKHKWAKGKEFKEITLINHRDSWYIKISYEVEPTKINHKTEITSIDAGINKLITTPYGTYGDKKLKEQIKKYSNKLRDLRKKCNKLGIKTSKRLERLETKFTSFIKNVYNREINRFITTESPKTVIAENLNIKNTKGKRGKSFNNRVSRSGLSGLKKRISMKCDEYGINFHLVNPAYTSQTCPNCGCVNKKNRCNESFKCVECSCVGDADYVASVNILRTFLGDDGSDKVCSWWPLEFHLGVESLIPKSQVHV